MNLDPLQFQYCDVSFHQGKPAVRFFKDEWGRLAEIEERVTLVGKFLKGRPPLEIIRQKFQSTFSLIGSAHVGSLDFCHILIRFSREDDCEKVLAKGLEMVAGKPMRLTRWSPDWSTRKESPLARVWVLFPGLPCHLFDPNSLQHLCRPVGKLLALDSATARRTRPSVARVKLELDLLKPLVDKIWIGFADEGVDPEDGFWQRLEYENVPAFCSKCFKFGHLFTSCKSGSDGCGISGVCSGSVMPPEVTKPAELGFSASVLNDVSVSAEVAGVEAKQSSVTEEEAGQIIPLETMLFPNALSPVAFPAVNSLVASDAMVAGGAGVHDGLGTHVRPKQRKKRNLKPVGLGNMGVQTRSMRKKGHRTDGISPQHHNSHPNQNSLLPNSNTNTSSLSTMTHHPTQNVQTQNPFLATHSNSTPTKPNQNTLPIIPLEETAQASIDHKSPNFSSFSFPRPSNLVPFSKRARNSAERAILGGTTPSQYVSSWEVEGPLNPRVVSQSESEWDDKMYDHYSEDDLWSNEVTDLVGHDYG